MSEPIPPRLGISTTVALAGIPALGYGYAFVFQWGYLRRYALPVWLVEVSLESLIIGVGAVLLILLCVSFVLQSIPRAPWWALIYNVVVTLLPGFFIYMAIISMPFLSWRSWPETILMICLYLVILLSVTAILLQVLIRFIRPAFVGEGPYLERLRREVVQEVHRPKMDAQSAIVESLDRAGWDASLYLFPAFLMLLIIPFALYWMGKGRARFQFEYPVMQKQEPCAVVGMKGQHLICVNVDTVRRAAFESFSLVPPAEAGVIRTMHLGALPVDPPFPEVDIRATRDSLEVLMRRSETRWH